MVCGTAWIPSSLLGHLKSHGLVPTLEQVHELQSDIVQHMVNETTDIISPLPGGPPVEGLSITHNGHCCQHCSYCSPKFSSFKKHWGQKHPDIKIPAREAFQLGDIQTFFSPSPQRWFRVNPSLSCQPLTDPFAIYLNKHLPVLSHTSIIASATHAREIPPLLQVTNWHIHLQEYTADKNRLDGLRKLMSLPSLRNSPPLLVNLKESVFQYMVIIRDNAKQSAIGIKRLLMECPR